MLHFPYKYVRIAENYDIYRILKGEKMAKVYVFLANGVEEIEALTVVDVLRRGGMEVTTVSVTGKKEILGSHGIPIGADELFDEDTLLDGDMLVLPGGLKGTNALMAHEGLRNLLMAYRDADRFITAICAAPSVLGMNGLLKGRRATCYPGFEDKLLGAEATGEDVVQDGNIITGKGMGVSIPFALKLLSVFSPEKAEEVGKKIQFPG